jgi:ribonuclease J
MAERKAKRREAGESELVLLALGGLGEIGMNCYLYGVGPADDREWLLVDLGITFPEGEFDPGVDVILPDLKFLEAERNNLSGLVLTHAHEDHFGAVIELWPKFNKPVYATPFTAALLRAKLAEFGGSVKLKIIEVELDSRFNVGGFDLELVSMAHSIPEPNGLIIRTPQGTVLHTGDWKLDPTPVLGAPTDEAKLRRLGGEGVLALVCDSTNAMREGRSPSELDVAKSIGSIIRDAKQRVAVTIFASNVTRIKAVADAARASGRQLVVAGRAMHRMIEVAIETGYLPKGFRYHDQQHFQYLKPEQTVVMLTGSQGEPRAALARVAERQHPEVKLDKGDLVIFSSRTIPGNEKEVGRIQNKLVEQGVELITDSDALVHVTGHPRREELKEMYGWVKPRIAIPMHGEARHLAAHAALATAAGVPDVLVARNGDIVLIGPGKPRIIDDAPVGRVFRDGNLLIGADESPVRERRKLSFVGIVIVSLVLSARGEIVVEPEVALDGIPEHDKAGRQMFDIILDAVEGTLKSIPPKRRGEAEMVREAVRRSVRAAVDQAWGKKPVTKVMLAQLSARS